MKKEQLILVAASIIGLFSAIAFYIEWVQFVPVGRLLFPLFIYSYYCMRIKKVQVAPTLIFILFWCTDFYSLCLEDDLRVLLILGICSYSILMFHGLIDMVKFRLNLTNVLSFTIIFSFIVFLCYSVIDLALLELGSYKAFIIVYGIVLSLNALIGAYNLNFRNRSHDLFFFFCATSFVFSDVSYLITEYYYKFKLLMIMNFILQLFGYYFVVRYFISREQIKNKRLHNN
jgi:hypothetical protein